MQLLFDAREQGDLARQLQLLHPDVVATTFADGRTLHGIAEVGAYFAQLQANGDRVEVTARRIVPEGHRVRVVGRMRTLTHGRLVDSPAAWTFEVLDGLVSRIAPAPCG